MVFYVVGQSEQKFIRAATITIEEAIKMKTRLIWVLIAGVVLMLGTSSWVSAKSGDPGDGAYTATDKEFYLTEAEVAFIRPGLEVEIMDVVIPADLQPEFSLGTVFGRELRGRTGS